MITASRVVSHTAGGSRTAYLRPEHTACRGCAPAGRPAVAVRWRPLESASVRSRATRTAAEGGASLASDSPRSTSSYDVPPDQVTRLVSVEEYDAMVAASSDKPALVMIKSKHCKPCRTFAPEFYRIADENQERVSFFELYGDQSKDTIKMVMKMQVKTTPSFRLYKGGKEVHNHGGISGETLLQALDDWA